MKVKVIVVTTAFASIEITRLGDVLRSFQTSFFEMNFKTWQIFFCDGLAVWQDPRYASKTFYE